MSATINRCPRCDQAACPAAREVWEHLAAKADAYSPRAIAAPMAVSGCSLTTLCGGPPVDWRARAMEAEALAARLRDALASLLESYDLAMGPESPLPPPVKDVVRGCFWDAGDARAALAAAKGETGGGMSDELKAER